MNANLRQLSKFVSLVLRHKPDLLDLSLDPQGWTDLDVLIDRAQDAGAPLTREALDRIQAENDKQRFEIDGNRIRARYGHTVGVQLEMTPEPPPDVLYHGTVERYLDAIRREGLSRRQRQYVFLSPDIKTAESVGRRRGVPVILTVDARRMHADGHAFYQPERSIWVTRGVPPEYIQTDGV